MRKWQSAAFAGTAAAILLTAGCGSQTPQQNQDTVQPAAGTGNTSGGDYGSGGGYGSDGYDSQGEGKKPASAGKLTVADDQKLGDIVTDSKGFTLYRFDKDTPKPPKSNCDGDCATAWPPVAADDATATAGIDPADLGSVTRKDGSKQLTIGGWPAYRFAKDAAPGDTKGHGVGGTWNALAPDGKKAGAAEADQPPLSVADNEELGQIIVDGKGRTVYRFTKDSAWPMKSACVGKCLDTWKPVRPGELSKVEGINRKLLTTFDRPDGTKQLTIDCWPLYWFTGDLKPGDVNGQGVNGTWFAVSPNGKLIKDTAQ